MSQARRSPRTVVFDLGKVLLDFDYGIAARKIAASGRVSPEEARKVIDHSPLLFRLETGEIDHKQFYQEVRAATGFTGAYEEFAGAFAGIFVPIQPMIDLSARLRAGGIPTFIFSNTNGIAVGYIRRSFPFFAQFQGYVYSYQHGAMKPNPKVYEVVERLTGAKGENLLFIDDRPENVEAGMARGWQGVVHRSVDETLAALERMNLEAAKR